jgi:acylphosphatase
MRMMNKPICMRFLVTGKVQGVWYRASTKTEADRLGLTGWAANLADGRVEVVVCGNEEKIMQLYAWLKIGPPLAKVDEVTTELLEPASYLEFEVR